LLEWGCDGVWLFCCVVVFRRARCL